VFERVTSGGGRLVIKLVDGDGESWSCAACNGWASASRLSMRSVEIAGVIS
jgi:hypothetical protein